MLRTVSLQRRNELAPPYHRKIAATPAAALRLPAALFLQNFESAIKAASESPRNNVGLSPCASRETVRVFTNLKRGGRQWR
jgi:hypothetical protein